jgi:hypothetical protein
MLTAHFYSAIMGSVQPYPIKGVEMNLTTKHRGNIALAQALSYFGSKGYYLFLPVGDNGGAIDLAVSEDGISLKRVQCKYTQLRHPEMAKKHPDRNIWQVGLQSIGRGVKGIVTRELYTEDSFDYLFITTPQESYLIEWKPFCQALGYVPRSIILGSKMEKYRVE